ncbi:MAG: hypothetical protein DMF82_17035 [Acidobacteria bacterium]|nr:MAG: hypothetical protein DMF82_17035 [Acidobacteriota bacterium]
MFLAATMAATAAEAPVALRGVVLDASRMPIAGALVTAVPEAGGPVSKTRTDGRGAFVLALAPGRYVVMVVAPGFREARQGLDATAAGSAARDFVLEMPSFRETVTVSAPPGYQVADISSATRTLTPLRDVPQAVTVATRELMRDQLMTGMGDVLRYVPGVAVHQGENNRDQAIIRGNSSSADFFLDGVRDDVQYYRDLYNLECVEALKGPTAMIFGRGGGGGVVNRVRKEAVFSPLSELTLQGGDYRHKRAAVDLDRPLSDEIALRVNGMYESSDSFRRAVGRERYALNPTLTFAPGARTTIASTRISCRGRWPRTRAASRSPPTTTRPRAGTSSTRPTSSTRRRAGPCDTLFSPEWRSDGRSPTTSATPVSSARPRRPGCRTGFPPSNCR